MRLASVFGLLTLLAFVAPSPDGARAAPPEVPPPSAPPALTLGDILQNSDFQPSPWTLEALAREGLAFDRDEPVLMPPRRAEGDVMRVVGEIAVLEGRSEFVSDFGNGRYGLRYDNGRQDPMTISEAFIDQFGDVYDFIAVWTAFWDYGADGLAYYVPIYQDTHGIGDSRYNQRPYWGSSNGGKLQGFLNMKSIDVYGDIRNPNNYVYPVMGQEFSHRWLAQMQFQRADGTNSNAMLGRDGAHWSSLLQAEGSVQDGNTWRDNGDGTFTTLEFMVRYSPLDLYGMGLFRADEVPDFFLIENARYRNQSINGRVELPEGITISGTRTEITIDDVIAANGARRPAAGDAPTDFRMAFILVTRPGETAEDVQDQLDQIETFRNIWEDTYSEWTHGRSTMCTRVTAKCDRPALKITNQSAHELVGDGDGMPEPGETIGISMTVQNVGGGVAADTTLSVSVPDGLDLGIEQTFLSGGDIAPGESQEFEDVFVITVGQDAECGQDVTATLQATTGDYYVQATVMFPIGYKFIFHDDFSTDRGWQVDPLGEDTAESGTWERSVPTGVDAGQVGLDFQTQPGGDVAGDGRALVTGATRGQGLGGNDVDEGTTSVVSPPIPLADTVDPWLSYYSWRTGLDFNAVPGQVLEEDNDALTVEITPDEGLTWVLIDSDISNDQEWKMKSFRILDLLPELPSSLRLRFTARDVEPQSLSEAAIDNVRVWDLQESCYEEVVEPTDPTDPGDPNNPGDPADPANPGDPIDPGTANPAQPVVGGRSSGGCSGAGGVPALFAGAVMALLLLRRRRRDVQG